MCLETTTDFHIFRTRQAEIDPVELVDFTIYIGRSKFTGGAITGDSYCTVWLGYTTDIATCSLAC